MYIPLTNFAAKDRYPYGDPRRAIVGAELAVEFDAISAELAGKADAPAGGGDAVITDPDAGQTIAKGWGQTAVALTDAATTTIDADLGNIFTWTIAGNRTLAFPTNLRPCQEIFLIITTSGINRTITYAAGWYKPTGVEIQPSASTAKVAVLRARANEDATRLYVVHFYNDYVAA